MELYAAMFNEWELYKLEVYPGVYITKNFADCTTASEKTSAEMTSANEEFDKKVNEILAMRYCDDEVVIVEESPIYEATKLSALRTDIETPPFCIMFANLDLHEEEANTFKKDEDHPKKYDILKFCNTFGLPSPFDNPLYCDCGYDTKPADLRAMSKLKIGRWVVYVRNLLSLTQELNKEDKHDWRVIFEAIIYFLFVADYKLFATEPRPEATDAWIFDVPQAFDAYLRSYPNRPEEERSELHPDHTIHLIHRFIKTAKDNPEDLQSAHWECPWQDNEDYQKFAAYFLELFDKSSTIHFENISRYGEFSIAGGIWSENDIAPERFADVTETTLRIGKILLCHILNFHLRHFRFAVTVGANGKITKSFMPQSLLDVMFAELFFAQNNSFIIAKCKICGTFFSRIYGRKTKIYCSIQCKNNAAARNKRAGRATPRRSSIDIEQITAGILYD